MKKIKISELLKYKMGPLERQIPELPMKDFSVIKNIEIFIEGIKFDYPLVLWVNPYFRIFIENDYDDIYWAKDNFRYYLQRHEGSDRYDLFVKKIKGKLYLYYFKCSAISLYFFRKGYVSFEDCARCASGATLTNHLFRLFYAEEVLRTLIYQQYYPLLVEIHEEGLNASKKLDSNLEIFYGQKQGRILSIFSEVKKEAKVELNVDKSDFISFLVNYVEKREVKCNIIEDVSLGEYQDHLLKKYQDYYPNFDMNLINKYSSSIKMLLYLDVCCMFPLLPEEDMPEDPYDFLVRHNYNCFYVANYFLERIK